MKIIKLTTFPWLLTQEEFNNYTPNNDGIVKGYKFYVNDDCDECDFWIVRGNIQKKIEKVQCTIGNLIFLQDEVYDERDYKIDFLSQFDAVVGPRQDLHHRRYIHCHEMFPWLFKNKTYQELMKPVELNIRTNRLCMMTSDATWLKGHRIRFAFSNQLYGHFKNRIDIYGRGFTPFECKFEVLKKYKYCIALENNVYPGYFTEKLNECYLSEVLPFYYGCPDLDNYYDTNSFFKIDAEKLIESINIIEKAIDSDIYESKIPLIREMKLKYFQNYHLPNKLIEILESNFSVINKKKKVTVYSELFFTDFKRGLFYFNTGIKHLAARSLTKIISHK